MEIAREMVGTGLVAQMGTTEIILRASACGRVYNLARLGPRIKSRFESHAAGLGLPDDPLVGVRTIQAKEGE